jgi:cytoskeletal protein RodZ
LHSLGLKEARERKGITLEEVSQALKISKPYINALEKGDFDVLPEPVFSRGYIRSYCQFLEVDPKEIFDIYNDYISTREPVKFEPLKSTPGREKKMIRLKGLPAWILTGLALLLLIILVLSYQIKKEKSKLALRAKLETEFAHNASDMVEETAKGGESPEISQSRGDSERAQASLTKGKKVEDNGNETRGEENIQGLNLNLEARELTWLYIVPDSKSPIDVTLYPGDRLRIKAKKTIKFKLGNAGGVSAVLNGREIGPLGKSGEVVEKTLSIEEEE